MQSRMILLVSLTSFLVLLVCSSLYAQGPVDGVDYAWVDLGTEDAGVLLSLAANGGDGFTEPDTQAGVDCKKAPFPYDGPGHNHMYFDVDDSFIMGGENEVWLVTEYFDSGEADAAIDCQYDSNGAGPVEGAFRGAGDGAFDELAIENTETWRIHIWYMPDARFENRGNGHDCRFSTHARGDMWFNRVWVFLTEPPDPFDPDNISGDVAAVQARDKLTTTWGTLRQES